MSDLVGLSVFLTLFRACQSAHNRSELFRESSGPSQVW